MSRSFFKDNFALKCSVAIVSIIIFRYAGNRTEPSLKEKGENLNSDPPKLKYWLSYLNGSTNVLHTAENVLKMLGWEETKNDASTNKSLHYDWDLLWSHDHHTVLPVDWSRIKYHQKINHIPGCRYLTSKSMLGVGSDSKYIPKAFLTVDDVKKYAEIHPNKRFVVKLKSNRGVMLQKVTEMNFTNTGSLSDFFAMEYLENPLLFNGYKFDFAVYVVITSFNPLRLYYHNKNTLLRFCTKPYNSKDPKDVDSYAMANLRTVGADFPGIKEYHDNGYTYKDGFNVFLRSKGIDVKKVWDDVEDLVRSVVLSKEHYFIKENNIFKGPRQSYFEMYRFDMFLDNDANLFLFEINQSPNIQASGAFAKNKHIYEGVLFNLFNLIGVGRSYRTKNLKIISKAEESIAVHANSLKVTPEVCLSDLANNSTCGPEHVLCWHCLDAPRKYDRITAYLEQMNSGEMKRLFPPSKEFLKGASDEFWNSLLPESKLHAKWFIEMCKKDEKFC